MQKSAEPPNDSIETRITDLEKYHSEWMERLDDTQVELKRIESDLLESYRKFYRNSVENNSSFLL